MKQATTNEVADQTASPPFGGSAARGAIIVGLLAVVFALATPSGLRANGDYPHLDPKTGYRMGHYRAALPDSAPGSSRIDLKTLREKIAGGQVILVDVNAHVGAGFDPITGEWFVQQKRFDIPGSTWLPNVGGGYLTPIMERYFRENLEKLTGGDRSRGIALYCQADCWMSWNASKRAASWGYTNLYWFPNGDSGWKEGGYDLVETTPVPVSVD